MAQRKGRVKIGLRPFKQVGSGVSVFEQVLADLRALRRELLAQGVDLGALEQSVAALFGAPPLQTIAAEAFAVGEVVSVYGTRADHTVPQDAGLILGLAAFPAVPGGVLSIAETGKVVALPGYAAGDILWAGAAGALTAVPPTTGFQQRVAIALNPSSVLVSLGEPIVLA